MAMTTASPISEMKTFNNSLAHQFFVLISAIIILALSFSAYLQYKNESKNIKNSLTSHGNSLAELLASISIDPLLIFDDVTLNSYAEFTSKQKDIVFAAVVNLDKVSLTHYLNRENPYIKIIPGSKTAVDIQPLLEALIKNSNILFVEVPVIFKGKTLAHSWVGLDRMPYEKESFKTLVQIIAVTFGVGLFVASSIFFLFKKKIFKPIEILNQNAQKIAKFEFENPVVVSGKGELTILAESFDKMRFQLKEMIESRNKVMDDLSELNESLEERVNERTKELQLLNSKIVHQAMHDPLTGLPNRALIVEQLKKEISHSKRSNTTLSVFMIDLNNFKDVNDTLGHPVGDGLLKDVAQRLRLSLRESDTVGRLGGDEFAVVLPGVSEDEAISVATKIKERLEPSFTLDDHVLKIGASVGIALYPAHGDDHTSLIRVADVAMYEAKKSNSHVCVYQPDLDKHTKMRLALMNDLHEAITSDQLELYYQPKISISKSKVVSVEGLIRWYHPENGWIMPDEFIALAEGSKLINELSYWVLDHAFAQWKTWSDSGLDLQIAVNLSAQNLVDEKLPGYISMLNDKYNMLPGGIKVEITESTIMSNIEIAMAIMADPHMQNLQFSIDDFGTGYSSLSYLKKLSVNEVKIDKAFVSEMSHDEDDEQIVKSVIDLAHNLGHNVVAEGVESKDVYDRLVSMGCDEVQGYYFSKPVPADELLSAVHAIESGLTEQ